MHESYDMGSYDPEMDGYVPPEISLRSLRVGEKIGEGSFSEVYRGTIVGDDDETCPPETTKNVIVKNYKKNVHSRDWFSFYVDERTTCRRLFDVGCVGVAPFFGVCGSDAYLVWGDVGIETLEVCLTASQKDSTTDAFARMRNALDARDDRDDRDGIDNRHDAVTSTFTITSTQTRSVVFRRIAKALIDATNALHAENVIHRDVKPENVLVVENSVVLVDLGGSSDFETGVNVNSGETIFDPVYGAPEQFTRDTRGAAKKKSLFGFLQSAVTGEDANAIGLAATGIEPSPKLDAFAVGMTLLRIGLTALHDPETMQRTRLAMDAIAAESDRGESVLRAWRQSDDANEYDFTTLEASGVSDVLFGLLSWDPETRMTLTEASMHVCFIAGE